MEVLVVEFKSASNHLIDRGVVINSIHGSWRTNRALFLAAGTYTIKLEPSENHLGQPSEDYSPPSIDDVVLQFTNLFKPKQIRFTSTV